MSEEEEKIELTEEDLLKLKDKLNSDKTLIKGIFLGVVFSLFAALFVLFFQRYYNMWSEQTKTLAFLLCGLALVVTIYGIAKSYQKVEKNEEITNNKYLHKLFKNKQKEDKKQ